MDDHPGPVVHVRPVGQAPGEGVQSGEGVAEGRVVAPAPRRGLVGVLRGHVAVEPGGVALVEGEEEPGAELAPEPLDQPRGQGPGLPRLLTRVRRDRSQELGGDVGGVLLERVRHPRLLVRQVDDGTAAAPRGRGQLLDEAEGLRRSAEDPVPSSDLEPVGVPVGGPTVEPLVGARAQVVGGADPPGPGRRLQDRPARREARGQAGDAGAQHHDLIARHRPPPPRRGQNRTGSGKASSTRSR